MHTDNPQWVTPALDVIRRTDAATWHRMQASPWHVHVISRGDEQSLAAYGRMYGLGNEYHLAGVLEEAFGVTPSEPDGTPVHVSFINRPMVEEQARRMGVPAGDFLAVVLVHEFHHDEGDVSEKSTFAVSTAFARKLPSRDAPIARLSRQGEQDS